MRRTYPEIYVLRHGETYWNREPRVQGRLHSDLTPLGRDQARRQGEILVELGLNARALPIFVSPQGRTRQTAEIALAPLGRYGQTDARLVEIGCGAFEGKSLAELEAHAPGTTAARAADALGWYTDVPGGEPEADVIARAQSFLDDLNGPAIIISHGITTRYLRALWLGLPREEVPKLPGDHGCIYHLCDGVHRVIT